MTFDEAVPPSQHEAGSVNAANPWPGLLAFQETDHGYFQGRRTETEELFRLVMRERFVVLFGLSGLGKSSLLQAGVFPRLRTEQVFPVYVRLDFSTAPLDLLAQVLAAIAREADARQIEAPVARDGDTLWEYFHREGNDFWTARNRPVMPLLVFDQFEEVFTLGSGDPARTEAVHIFLNQLADLVECRPPAALKAWIDAHPEEAEAFRYGRHHYKTLLSIREDFLADLEALRARMPSVALGRFRLFRMNGEAALQVVGQARQLIEPEVAEKVVRFVAAGQRGVPLAELEVEPALLSVVCRELNNKRAARGEARISAALLEGSQEQVLAEFYERSLSDLPSEIRVFIEDHLLTVSGYRDSVALENALSGPGVSRQSVDRLVERRLLRREDRGGSERLELTHDLLARVVRTSRDSRRQRQKAEDQRLALMRAEEERRRELESEREKRRKDQRDLKRFRLVASVFVVLGVVAIGAAVWALQAQRAAAREREVARTAWARSSVKEAVELFESDRAPESLAYFALALRTDPHSIVARSWIAEFILRKVWWLPRATLQQHENSLTGAAFSADGRRLVTASDNGTAQVWDTDTGKPIGQPLRHAGSVMSAAFSPDGRHVVTASFDNTARVWDAETGEPIGRPLKHSGDGWVSVAVFSADGKRVLTASAAATAQVWDAETGAPIGPALRHNGPIVAAAFIDDGRRVVAASQDVAAQVWDVESGARVGRGFPPNRELRLAVFSADGRRVITSYGDAVAQVWDVQTGQPLGPPLRQKYDIDDAAFSPDGRRVLMADGTVAQVWQIETGRPVGQALQHKALVSSAAFSADGRRIVTSLYDGTAQVWEVETGRPVGMPLQHGRLIRAALSADGRRVVTIANDNTAQIWGPETVGIARPVQQFTGSRESAAFSADGRRVLTSSDEGTAQVWDTDTGKPAGAPWQETAIRSGSFSADGRRVLTASSKAHVWDPETGKPIGVPLESDLSGGTPIISADGRRVLTTPNSNKAHVWDADTGRPVGVLLEHMNIVRSAAFSADGRRVVTTADKTAQVWETETGKPIGAPLKHEGSVKSAAFSADGRRIVTIAYETQVWDAETGKPLGKPWAISGSSAMFSQDGRRVLIAPSDGPTARVVEAETGAPVGTPMTHKDKIRGAAFSTDGRRVVTASLDATAQVWDAETGKAVGLPLVHSNPVLFAAFSTDGKRVLTVSGDPAGAVYAPDERKAWVWDLLIDSGTAAETSLLADLAEALGGYRVNELGSLVPFSKTEQARLLDKIRGDAARAADRPDTVWWFLRRFFAIAQ